MAFTLLHLVRFPLKVLTWSILPFQVVFIYVLHVLSWLTDAWCRVLTSWGGQTVASSAVDQLSQYQVMVNRLQHCALQQKHELQELREQLSAAAAVKSALSLKYKQIKAINTQLKDSLTDMEADAAAAGPLTKVISKAHTTYTTTPRSPPRAGTPLAPRSPLKAPSRGSSPDPGVYSHRRPSQGFIWSTHVALLAACLAIRWCDGLMRATVESSKKGGGGPGGQWQGSGTGGASLAMQLLPLGSNRYWFGTTVVVVAYCLWLVRVLPGRDAVNRTLMVVGWVTAGCCLQLGWLAQRLKVVMDHQASAAAAMAVMNMGTGAGHVMVGGAGHVPVGYVQVPAQHGCPMGGPNCATGLT